MSEIKRLLNSLLWEIYGRTPSSITKRRVKNQKNKMHPKLYEKHLLQRLSPNVLKDICEILKFEIRLMSKYLERVLISRDKNQTHRTVLYGFLDIIVSSRFGESSRDMRLSLTSPPGNAAQKGRADPAVAAAPAGRPIIADETNSSSDFNQWLHAMKMVARLPGGMPPEFRRKLWLALSDKYLKSKNVDWEKEEVKCFSEQWREDDEELGIQIVKDLHRTGSSLCSGPAGTINQAKLKRILLGYARFNPEVGYCQGFNMLGALILQVMDKEEIESIKVMIYLVEGILPSGYFSGSLGGLQADMAVFRELMTSKLPRLAKHLQKLQGPVENAFEPPLTNVFTMQWFLTMFCTCLPMTCVLRVWDLVLIEGSDVLLRTALVLWSLLEERILNARTADDFYCQMGSFSSELLNGHLVDSNGLIEKVVDLGPIPELQKLRDKHLYNITPFRDKKGLQLYYSDEDGDSDEDSRMAVATAWGLRLRRGSAGLGSKIEGKDRIALDISLLKKQYDRLRERQRQAHIILTSAVARQSTNSNQTSMQMNQLLIGRNAIVTNNGRRLGPPQGAIPPARKPSLPTSKPPKLAQTKKLLSGETLHWRDTDLSKKRRGSLKWKDIKSDGSQSGQDDRPATLIESAPSSRSSSSEPKSKRMSLKASRQRSDSSSYSEESDGDSSTSTSLCDEDEIADHTLSSLEGSPMRKSKSSKKHSEVTKQKSLEDVLNSNDGQPTIDNQIPFIQLTTIESPILNANKKDIESLEYVKEDSETESNRLDYAGFVDEFSWPDINEPTSSGSLEDTTIEVTSMEGDFLSLSNVITSTSQLSPIPDITTYMNNSNISPLRTPISAFDYANLVESMDDSKKFEISDEGVTNEYFERVNIVERPTKLDLLYSLNEEDSIRNAYVSVEPSPESSKENLVTEIPKVKEPEVDNPKVEKASDKELDRKMKVLLEYSNQSSLSFIAEAKQEISSGMFKEVEFDAESLKYQPSTLVPLKKAHLVHSKTITDDNMDHVIVVPSVLKDTKTMSPPNPAPKEEPNVDKSLEVQGDSGDTSLPEIIDQSAKNLAEEISESTLPVEKESILKSNNIQEESQRQNKLLHEEQEVKSYEDLPVKNGGSTIPSTEDLETRFRALELNFSDRKESLKNETRQDLPATTTAIHVESSSEGSTLPKPIVEETNVHAKRQSLSSISERDFELSSKTISSPNKGKRSSVVSNLEEKKESEFPNMSEDAKDTKVDHSLRTKDDKENLYPLSPVTVLSKKDPEMVHSLMKNQDIDSNYRFQSEDKESVSKDNTLPKNDKEELAISSPIKDSLNEDLNAAVLPDEILVKQYQSPAEESVSKDCTGEKKQSFSYKENIDDLSIHQSSSNKPLIEDLKITSVSINEDQENRSNYDIHTDLVRRKSIEEAAKPSTSKERTEEFAISSPGRKYSKESRNSADYQNQYSTYAKESTESETSDSKTKLPLMDEQNNDWKPSEKYDFDCHQQHSTVKELIKKERILDEKEISELHDTFKEPKAINEPKDSIDYGTQEQSKSQAGDSDIKSKPSDTKEIYALKKENIENLKSTEEPLTQDSEQVKVEQKKSNVINSFKEQPPSEAGLQDKYEVGKKEEDLRSADLQSENYDQSADKSIRKVKVIEDRKESIGEEFPPAEKTPSQESVDSKQNNSVLLLKDQIELPSNEMLKDLTSDTKRVIEESVVQNLSDDRKQSLLPKEDKHNKLSQEDILYYEYHTANEDGSEVEGLSEPNQNQDLPKEDQSKELNNHSSQENAVAQMETVQVKKSSMQSLTRTPSNKDLKPEDPEKLDYAIITTADQPLSTYSFSYTQDHFNNYVSLLSEVQSSIPSESSKTQQVCNALQSTIDLRHSLQNSVAVTTSVSLRNSASLKTSVSVKSSVSLKSSSLYDRERSLQVNTGVTVFEDPNYTDSKTILSKELVTNEDIENSIKENLMQNKKTLEDKQNNAVKISVVKSEYKDLANKSNINLSMQLPSFYGINFSDEPDSKRQSILERESLQPVDGSSSENINNGPTVEEISKKSSTDESSKGSKFSEQTQKEKSAFSQELEERFRALERRFSDRSLPLSKDAIAEKKSTDQSETRDQETKKEQVLTLDVNPMKLKVDATSPSKSSTSSQTEVISTEETIRSLPSTADLELRFRELERKLSTKNIILPTKTEERQQEESSESKQCSSTHNPSIILSENGNAPSMIPPSEKENTPRSNENTDVENQPTLTRKRIPSTEDLETRFEALEIQKSLKSPTNLLSPSQIKEGFVVSTPEQESKRKSEIPSTEDLENRFQAFEESKKIKQSTKLEKNSSQTELTSKSNSTEAQGKTSTKDSDTELSTKTKEIPKVTFAEIETKPKKPVEHSKPIEEVSTQTHESPTTCDSNKEKILRKVPSARDLEARFEALEKRKSFTGFSTKTQEYLLAEQNRNHLSAESLNSLEDLKRREINDKKVASTEDLVQRLDALEQRMAITENCIKTKISPPETSNLSQAKEKFPSNKDLESRVEGLQQCNSFTETTEHDIRNKTDVSMATTPSKLNSTNLSQETKLILLKRSLFSDAEPETKNLPSTEDLENRFDALEQQKTRSFCTNKKTPSSKEEIQEKNTSFDPKADYSTENWERLSSLGKQKPKSTTQTNIKPQWEKETQSKLPSLEHQIQKTSTYTNIKPQWENEVQSKLPSTKDLESRYDALEQQKARIDRSSSKSKAFQTRPLNDKSTTFYVKPQVPLIIEKPPKALASRSIDQVIEQISSKTKEIEREHQMSSKIPSTQDLEIRYNDLQINTKRGDESDSENVQNLEQTTDCIELTGNHKRRDLYKLESQSDETLTASHPINTEFDTKTESRPTSCPEYRDPFDSNIVTTDRVLKIIEENSKILHRILKKTLADSGGTNESASQPLNSHSGFTDSLLALGNIFPRNDESISPNRIKSQSRVRSTITFRSDDSSITDRLASIKSTIKSIDTLCEDQSSRKDKCQRYIDSLFTTRSDNAISPTPPVAGPLIRVDDCSRSPQERVAMRELKKEASPRRRRDEDREEYESRVRRDMMPNSVDAPSEFSCSLENIAKVDSEVDRINQDKQVETQLERPLSPYYAPGYDLNNRSITPVVYIPTKLEIRHTTVTSTFYDRYLTEKHIERTFPRSKKHSPVSPTITKSYLDISKYASTNLDDRSSKSAENSPSRRKDGISPNQTVSPAAYKRSFISSLEVAQKDLHIRSCDNILLQLRSSTHNQEVVPSIMMYNPLPTKIRKPPELGISLGLYKDYGSDASSKS